MTPPIRPELPLPPTTPQAAPVMPVAPKRVSPFYMRYLEDQAASIRARGGDDTAVNHFLDLEDGKPFSGQVSGPTVDELLGDATPSYLRGVSMALVQGATFGFGDEAVGSLLGLATGVGARRGIDEYRREYADWAKEHHGAALAAEIAGGIVVPGANLMRAAKGIGGMAKVGLVTGGAYGAGNAEGGVSDRVMGALTGAAVGGVSGGALGALGSWVVAPAVEKLASTEVGKAIVKPIERAVSRTTGRETLALTPEPRARQRLAEALQAENIDFNALEQRLVDLHRSGVSASVLDAGGDELLALASGVLKDRSPLTTRVIEELQARQAGQSERLPAALLASATKRQRFGVANAHEVADALHVEGLATSKPHYEAAHEQVVALTPRMQKLLNHPDIRKAYNAGAETASIEDLAGSGHGLALSALPDNAVTLQSIMAANPKMDEATARKVLKASGAAELTELPVRGIDYLARGLRLVINSRYKEGTLDAQGAKALMSLRDELVTEAMRQSPAFAKARAAYSGPVQSRDAIESGLGMLRMAPHDIAKAMRKLAPADRDFARLGYTQAVYEALAKSGSDNVAKSFFGGSLFGKPSFRLDQVRALFPDAPEAAEAFARTLAGETRASHTFGRAVSAPGATSVEKLEQQAIGALPSGAGPRGIAVSAARGALQRFRAGVSKDEADELTHLFSKGLSRSPDDTGVLPRELRVLLDDLRYSYGGVAAKKVARGAVARAAAQTTQR